ncbi:hypothetical protein EWM64_g7984 [Hericium alpestre]|uniref:Uncharacterized protein n=1 Tax=Hericium alpestre TaxID=135208 RepID=A0A4Y9ZR98_9AGAM|nr:hypothetical protein EWM64_g7984 [Hericium alpestre]
MSSSPHSRRLAAAVVIGVGATAAALASGALSSKREKQPHSVYGMYVSFNAVALVWNAETHVDTSAEAEDANDPKAKRQKGMTSAEVRRDIHGKVT